MAVVLQVGVSVLSFALTRCYIPAGCTWLFSRYVIKAPPIQFCSEVIVSLVTLGLMLPLLLPLIGLNLTVRLLFSLYLRLRYGSKVFLMGARDSFVSHDEFANSCNHYSLYVIKGQCEIQKIRDKFSWILEQRTPKGKVVYDRMKRRLIRKFGYYCWEHVGHQFQIEDHVKYLSNTDSNHVFTEDQVFSEIQKVYDYPFQRESKPMWEILVIPKFKYRDFSKDNNNCTMEDPNDSTGKIETDDQEEGEYYGFIVRMHHSIMDGISAGNALQHYISDTPNKLTVDPLCPSHKWSWSKTILAYLQVLIMGPRAFLRTLFLDETNCFHGPQLTGPKTLGWSKQVDVDALRKIKDCTKTSVTAVLVSALGGAVRNLALKKGLSLPSQVHAFPTIGILPFPDIRPRNRFTMALLPLCIGLDTPIERLKSAEMGLKNLLRSPDVLTNYHLMQVFGVLPYKIINFFLEQVHTTLLLSNVPGPAEKATIFGGDQIVDIGIWAPIQLGIGIGMSLFSYGGIVRATVVVDKTACSHPSDVPTIVEEFEKEIIHFAKYASVPLDQVFKQDL